MRPGLAEDVLIGQETPVYLRHPHRPSLLHLGAAWRSNNPKFDCALRKVVLLAVKMLRKMLNGNRLVAVPPA